MKKLIPVHYDVCEIKVSYRPMFNQQERPKVTDSLHAADLFRQAWDQGRLELVEDFHVMYLNRANNVLGMFHSTAGSVTGVMCDVKTVMATALKVNACSMILAHNHPSGSLNPSQQDKAITRQFREAAKVLGMEVLDHVILTRDGYYSFADEGMMF